MTYTPPVRDILFSLTQLAGAQRLEETGAYPDFDTETAAAVLEAAGDFTADVLAPLNRTGDLEGARFENGRVIAAPGFADAYRQFAEGGWNALSAPPDHGGQGLPKALGTAVFEMVHSANMAFGLCPMLTQGAIEALTAHGTEQQKALYLEKLVSGAWTGTMNLTEPQAGSDLALLRSRAEPDGNGKYKLYGQKIFITWGDHDAAENIAHLVLARLPDAPEGTRGISLFLAPKRLVNADGSLGDANKLGPVSIEHKLGIHASPTCVMAFDGAEAELVGVENQGLAQMFTMMNAARLQVGVEGVAIAERAYQGALAYARERKQGRSAWSGESPAAIIDHPDIRRMLLSMKARIAAARAICLSTAVAADLANALPDGDAREAAKLREELLTPIAKAWSTDIGVAVTSEALQIHGGMGYIEETGAAQHYRDARILPIYEGTNAIQAMDLAGRKLSLAGGKAIHALFDDIAQTIKALKDKGGLDEIAMPLEASAAAAQMAGLWLAERRGEPDALAGATMFLKLLGDVTGGWMLAKAALAAEQAPNGGSQITLARIYAAQVLAQAPGLAAGVTMGADVLTDMNALGG